MTCHPPCVAVTCQWVACGYCADRGRYWGPHLVCNLHRLPVAFALTGVKADERETLRDLPAVEPGLAMGHQARSPTGITTAASSNGSWHGWTCGACDQPAKANPNGPAHTHANRYGS